ncbi:MAG TPA: response regulator [Spirochaetota bacterium]|nr:response regulator [Spirochaetota bacterium]HPJ36746.1 response regulator [Spirochaetota bacterium]
MYTVLAIDDDKTTLGIIGNQLRALGYKVVTEISPVKGVELAKEFPPDVILLDLNMPVMNGFEVMKTLRKNKLTKEVPIVIFTINKDKESVVDALRSGAFDYIVKPHDPNKLSIKIKSAIRYGISRKAQNLDEFIEISHRGEMIVITMRGAIQETGFREAAKSLFTGFFMKNIRDKICIFDIKEMNDFTVEDVRELVKILSLFSEGKIKIVTGKHYGEIVSSTDLDDKVELYLSFGDLDHALDIES